MLEPSTAHIAAHHLFDQQSLAHLTGPCLQSRVAALQVEVREGQDEAALVEAARAAGGLSEQHVVYRLTAVVHHVRDADEDESNVAAKEGHLIAHIRVRTGPCFWHYKLCFGFGFGFGSILVITHKGSQCTVS